VVKLRVKKSNDLQFGMEGVDPNAYAQDVDLVALDSRDDRDFLS